MDVVNKKNKNINNSYLFANIINNVININYLSK